MSHSQVISEKKLLSTGIIDVKRAKVKIPNGKIHTHTNVYRIPSVLVFPLTPTYELYFLLQYRYLHKKVMLETVAGLMNEGESALAGAKRELLEESGITAGKLELFLKLHPFGSGIKTTEYLFLATDLEFGKAQLEEDEEIELIKMPLSDAVKKIETGEICNGAAVAGILYIDRLRREKKL